MDKFTQAYIPGCELAVDEAMNGFKGRFFLKEYLPGKPTKWGIKAWGLADSASGYLLKCDIYKGKNEIRQQDLLLGEHMGGVDVSDQRREYYGVGRSSKKWWKFILHFVLNVSLVNCFFSYDLTNPPLYSTRKQATDLQTKLGASADWYIHVSQAYRQEEKFAYRNLFHTLQKVSGRAKVCALCIEKKKKSSIRKG